MRVSAVMFCAIVALLGLSAGPAAAGDSKYVLAPEARTAPNGRGLEVLVGQGEIKSDINPSDVVAATGGGLLGALIDAKINSDRAKRAEAAIQPIRAALTNYDVDALANDASRVAGEKLTWFQPASVVFGRDTSVAGKVAVLDASKSGQMAFFEYTYDLSPDFSSVRVRVNMQFANVTTAEGKSTASRLDNKQLAFSQSIFAVVMLPSPSKDLHENAARWGDDGGRLTRGALATAFADVGLLIPRALELSAADAVAMKAKTHKAAWLGGYSGRVQEETPEGTLLFNGAFVHVRTLQP